MCLLHIPHKRAILLPYICMRKFVVWHLKIIFDVEVVHFCGGRHFCLNFFLVQYYKTHVQINTFSFLEMAFKSKQNSKPTSSLCHPILCDFNFNWPLSIIKPGSGFNILPPALSVLALTINTMYKPLLKFCHLQTSFFQGFLVFQLVLRHMYYI